MVAEAGFSRLVARELKRGSLLPAGENRSTSDSPRIAAPAKTICICKKYSYLCECVKKQNMARTVTVSLGPHYEEFIRQNIAGGRYNNASEVIRAALRRLEEDETRLAAMRAALIEGEESGIVEDFDPQEFLNRLNAKHDAEVQNL